MTDLPVWLLDVDGVINAWRPAWPEFRREKCTANGLTIRWAPELVDRIRALHAAGQVEVRWCTTWCGYPEQLDALGDLLGLKLVAAFGDRPLSKTWGEMKRDAALMVLGDGRRLVWTDDDEVDAARRLSPVLAEAEADGRALLVKPDSRGGLRAEDVEVIETWLATPAKPVMLLPNALDPECS